MDGGSHSRVQSAEVQNILTRTSSSAAPKPSPVEHVSIPSSPSVSGGSSARTSFQSHARTLSTATDMTSNGPPRSNRFSVSFPVQSCDSNSRSPQRSSTTSTTYQHEKTLSEAPLSHGPSDTNFLTAIAASERRVLELKEELQRAEADLNALKKQWAQHEATKKKEEVRMLTKLQPLQTTSPVIGSEDDTDGSSAWMQHEMERRKALLNGHKSSNRTVFAGSRHTRTLSLLSPGTMDPPGTFIHPARSARKDSVTSSSKRGLDASIPEHEPTNFKRASTALSDITYQQNNIDGGGNDQSLKKIATDLKDGLWTFWEDLRQATVGEEGTQQIPPPHLRRQGSNQTIHTAKKQSSRNSLKNGSEGRRHANKKSSNQSLRKEKPGPALADPSFWIEHGITSSSGQSKKAFNPKPPPSPKPPSVAESDTWDWEDSPKEPRTVLALDRASRPKPASDTMTPDLSKKRDSIPWPALSRAGSAAKQLRRTASHLMNEWEKSLTPSPGQEYTGQEDYLSFDASNPGHISQ